MLGSFFDLSKEVAAIAAKRQSHESASVIGEHEGDVAYDDFDRRMHAFMKLLTPNVSAHEAPPIRVRDLDAES